MKARDYLVKHNLAKPGRGKFSKVAHAFLRDALARGEKFSDYPKETVSLPAAGSEDAPRTVRPAYNPEGTRYLLPSEYRFPVAEYAAYVVVSGKKTEVGLAECCNSCKVSLVNHGCNSPTIHEFIPVSIEKR